MADGLRPCLSIRYDYAGKDENEVAAKLAKQAYVAMFERP